MGNSPGTVVFFQVFTPFQVLPALVHSPVLPGSYIICCQEFLAVTYMRVDQIRYSATPQVVSPALWFSVASGHPIVRTHHYLLTLC